MVLSCQLCYTYNKIIKCQVGMLVAWFTSVQEKMKIHKSLKKEFQVITVIRILIK